MLDEEEGQSRGWPLNAQVGELWGSHRALEKAFRAHEIWDAKQLDEVKGILKDQDVKADRMDDKLNTILQNQERTAGGREVWGWLGNRASVVALTLVTSGVGLLVALFNHFFIAH